MLALLGLLDI